MLHETGILERPGCYSCNMGVIETASSLRQVESLDAVWIQVGAFMELHGEPALSMNKAYGLGLWHRNGIPTVGVPVTHIEKWAHKSAGLGMTTGLAFQVEAGHKLSRELTGIVPGMQGKPSFSATGDPAHLGAAAPSDHLLQVNQVFATEVPGIFTPTRTYRRICDGAYCDHSSASLVCIPVGSPEAEVFLSHPTSEGISAIFPEAW